MSGDPWGSTGVPSAGDTLQIKGRVGRVVLRGDIRVDGLGGSGKGLLETANSDLEGVALNRDANDAAGGERGVSGRQLQ